MAAVEQLPSGDLVHPGERLDVGAGAEQRRVRRGDDHRPRAQPSISLPRLLERLDDDRRERVGGRVVEPDDRDVAARVELDRRASPSPRRAAGRDRSPARSWRRAGPGPPAGAAPAAARSPRPTPRSACSSAARTSSSPRKSARANGPGTMPVPIIIPRSMSRTPAMPSSSTRQASTSALSWKRSATRSSICVVVSGVLIEAPSRTWRRARRARPSPPCPCGRRSGRRRPRACRARP